MDKTEKARPKLQSHESLYVILIEIENKMYQVKVCTIKCRCEDCHCEVQKGRFLIFVDNYFYG